MKLVKKLLAARTAMKARKGGLASKMTGRKGDLAGKLKAKFAQKFCEGGSCAPKSICGPKGGFTRIDAVGIPMTVALIAMALAMLLGAGCATQPSRSQTMTIEGNIINVYVQPAVPNALCYASNAVPSGVAGGDTLCQAMMIETGGSEANVQEASHSPQLNLPVGDTAVSALGELIGAAIAGGTKALTKDDEKEPTTTP